MKKLYYSIFLLFFFNTALMAQPGGCATNLSPVNQSVNLDPYPSITLKWTPVAGATSYDIYMSAKTPPKQLIATVLSDSFNFINGAYNTTYNWYVVPKNAAGSVIGCTTTTTSFVTAPPPPPPANDNCSGATPLSGTTITATTLGATQSRPADECGGYTGNADDDVWFSFTATANETRTFTVTGNGSFDAVLEAFSGTCGNLAELNCSDSSQNGGSEAVTLNVTEGTTYYFRVYGFYADLVSRGTFSVSSMAAPLPVTLSSFSGERRNDQNLLKWVTASESNNKGFEVQYSADGMQFSAVSFVNSQSVNGNSSSKINYEFTDGRKLFGNSWYRLKQVDKDGRFIYSNVVMIKGDRSTGAVLTNVFPNPAINTIKVSFFSAASNTMTFQVSDVSGKIIMKADAAVHNGDNSLPVNISRLSSGTYFITGNGSDGSKTGMYKFVKQ